LLIGVSVISNNIATAIGKSKLVQIFLISLGAKFRIIFLLGSCVDILRNVALILSLDSLIAASGNHIISIPGRALLESASTVISNHCNHKLVKVLILCIIVFNNILNCVDWYRYNLFKLICNSFVKFFFDRFLLV